MGPSRILVVPGVRRATRAQWRTGVAAALATVVGQPSLWLLGALGFLLRGGIVLLTASIFVVPTQVELRMLLGENLGSMGLTPAFIGLLGAGGVLLGLLVIVALALLAYTELAAFERLVADSETAELREGRPAQAAAGPARRRLLGALFAIQLLAVVALVVAAAPLIAAVVSHTYAEIVRPTLGGSIYVRVLAGVRDPFFVFVAVVVALEMFSALATRRLLVRGFGLTGGGPPGSLAQIGRHLGRAVIAALIRPLRRPLPTLATLVLSWAATLLALMPLSWALAAAWDSVRGAYLGSVAADGSSMLAMGLVALALAAIWTVGLLLVGFASALRAALWSVDSLG